MVTAQNILKAGKLIRARAGCGAALKIDRNIACRGVINHPIGRTAAATEGITALQALDRVITARAGESLRNIQTIGPKEGIGVIAAQNRFNPDQRIFAIRAGRSASEQRNGDRATCWQIDGQVPQIGCPGITFDQVIAKPTVYGIGTITARKIIIPRAARNRVIIDPAVNGIVVITAVEGILTVQAKNSIVAIPPVRPVVADTGINVVIAGTAIQGIRPTVPAANKRVVTVTAKKVIAPGTAIKFIVTATTKQKIARFTAIEIIVAVAAIQGAETSTVINYIITVTAKQRVVTRII